jgi:hypothetical protein
MLKAVTLALLSRLFAAAPPAPTITWASQPVLPGETCVLQASSFGGATVLLTPLGHHGHGPQEATAVTPHTYGNASVFFTVPADIPVGPFSCRLESATRGLSAPFVVNRPDAWWWQGDLGNRSTSGGWLRVFGNSLSFPSAMPGSAARLCPVDSVGGCTVLVTAAENQSAYHAAFEIPAAPDMPAGEYHLALAACGGVTSCSDPDLAFTNASTFAFGPAAMPNFNTVTVVAGGPATWAGRPASGKVFDVTHFGATGFSCKTDRDDCGVDDFNATAAITAALEAARQAGGGVVYFPRGRYMLDVGRAGLVIPDNVVLKGEARHLASIYFAEYNQSTAPSYYVRGEGGSWGAEQLTFYVTGYFGSGEAHGGVFSLAGTNTFLRSIRAHANSMAGFETKNTLSNGRISTWGFYTLGILVSLAAAQNFEVIDSELYSEFQIFDTECSVANGGTAWGRIANNRIWNGAEVYRWCQANQIIFEYNKATSVSNRGGGGDISSYGSPPSTSNLWIANNEIRFTWGSDREVTTFDGAGGDGMYTGYVAAVEGNELVLSTPAQEGGMAGWVVNVLDGDGAGQYGRVVSISSDRRRLTMDRQLRGITTVPTTTTTTANAVQTTPPACLNLTGEWYGSDDPSVNITQTGARVHMVGVWGYGDGNLSGATLTMHTVNTQHGGFKGTLIGGLEDDCNVITWRSTTPYARTGHRLPPTPPTPPPAPHPTWNGSVIPARQPQSLIHLQPFRGRTLFFRNFIADTGVLQMYGQAFEVIVAEHVHERTDGIVSFGVTESAHDPWANCTTTACSFGANLMLQFLDNNFLESNHMFVWADASTSSCYNEYSFLAVHNNALTAWWNGPLARNLIYRRNRVVGYGGFAVNGNHHGSPPSGPTDVLVESNVVVNWTKAFFVNTTSTSNVVVRNCTPAWPAAGKRE